MLPPEHRRVRVAGLRPDSFLCPGRGCIISLRLRLPRSRTRHALRGCRRDEPLEPLDGRVELRHVDRVRGDESPQARLVRHGSLEFADQLLQGARVDLRRNRGPIDQVGAVRARLADVGEQHVQVRVDGLPHRRLGDVRLARLGPDVRLEDVRVRVDGRRDPGPIDQVLARRAGPTDVRPCDEVVQHVLPGGEVLTRRVATSDVRDADERLAGRARLADLIDRNPPARVR